jgi:hypothetical protein
MVVKPKIVLQVMLLLEFELRQKRVGGHLSKKNKIVGGQTKTAPRTKISNLV